MAEQEVERWCGARPGDDHIVHCFADASEQAYGCCIYLLCPGASQQHLIYAKARVVPVKKQSLAHLELQAALLASTSLDMVCGNLRANIRDVHCWTDSLTPYHWLQKASHSWKTWVANRVAAVQEVAKKWNAIWHHCPGVLNPADMASTRCHV